MWNRFYGLRNASEKHIPLSENYQYNVKNLNRSGLDPNRWV